MKSFTQLYALWKERKEDRRLISESGLFDPKYYLEQYPDVAQQRIDPLRHYLYHGRHEGRAPSEDFDPAFYVKSNLDVSQAGIDPFVHYIRHGWAEGRFSHSPQRMLVSSLRKLISDSGLFDPEFYRTAYIDVALSGREALQDYIDYGRQQRRRPSADFDPAFYLATNQDLQRPDIDPLLHYIESGRSEGRRGSEGINSSQLADVLTQIRNSGLFDDAFYLSQCPAVKEAGVDPLLHYVIGGLSPFVDPSPKFSALAYAVAHPEVRQSGLNPLIHFLNSSDAGAVEGEVARQKRPDDSVTFERKAGEAYFQRFLFSFDSVETASAYAREAVAELVCASPRLRIEKIEPEISIIVPVFGQLHFVLGCLDSLRRQLSNYSAEIILADDVSPASAGIEQLAAIPWLRYSRRETCAGFLENCNQAARLARGRFLVFLNSDTRVAQGWLDELIGSFHLFPKAGLVGSTLINADGALQEAGGIYWRDGSAWNYGRNDDPGHPKYCFARKVDYISAASIAIPSNLWHQMNGFDAIFQPAYCEDADLAFRIRQAGYEVWLQPLSRVIHYEGKTHGRDLDAGIKRYQKVNLRKFADRWQNTLLHHRLNGNQPDEEANRNVGDRILVLDALTPTPDRDSGSFITARMLKALQELGYQITFVPQHEYRYDETYTSALQRLGIECLYQPYFSSIADVLDYRANFEFVLAYRAGVLDQVYHDIRRRAPSARIIFHNVDLHFLREEREAALTGSRSKKIMAARTRASELELIAKVDCSIVHTSVEASIIRKHLPIENIVEFPYIAELHRSLVSREERCDVMFLGGLNHPPNADAVLHFTRSVWPALSRQLPECARLLIVGASPTGEIKEMAGTRVVVTGYVPDLQPYFDNARVFVAPIRYGAGIKGKVIQSLSYGTPSVITSVAAEGIGLTSGRETIIVATDSELVEQVLRVYSDNELWCSLQSSGYEFVEKNFSWKRGIELTTKALDTADAVWLNRHDRTLTSRLNDIVTAGPANNVNGVGTKTWVEPGHFYSPLINSKDPHVVETLKGFQKLELSEDSGINLDRKEMIEFFCQAVRHYHRLPFVEQKESDLHYYYENPLFGYGDAIMLGLMCFEFRPQQIVEIGSGFSSAAMIDLNEKSFCGTLNLTFLEPHPETLLGLLPSRSKYQAKIIAEPVQSVPLDVFKELRANDILFIDSTHVAKMASDVNHVFFNVLPILQPGVLIHVHDIFYPFEYPPDWVLNENRSWNEAYLLRAFLQFNKVFDILFYNHYAVRKFPELLQRKAPLFLKNGGGSLWMQKTQ